MQHAMLAAVISAAPVICEDARQVRDMLIALVSLSGGAGGALSYVAGVHLSDVDFAHPLRGPLVIAALWALLFPLLLALSARVGRAIDPLQAWPPAAGRALD